MNLKAQLGVKELIMTLVLAGILAIVGLLIFSNVSNTSKDIFAKDTKVKKNEQFTIGCSVAGQDGTCDNSTLLAEKGYIENKESVVNASSGRTLTRNTDYIITLVGGFASGDLDARANFTLLNMTNKTLGGNTGFNNSQLNITYQFNAKSAARLTAEKVDDTTLDSFELGVVALIVLAAITILATVYWLGR